MHIFWFISFFALSFFSIYLHTHYALVKDLTELGEKTCSDLDDLRLNIDNIWHFISNLINTRNVYYGKYKNRNVYIKQLSQNPEFEDYIVCCVSNFYCRNGTSQHQQIMVFDEFHICSWNTSTRFFKQFITLEDLEEWTGSALINPEPLLLKVTNISYN